MKLSSKDPATLTAGQINKELDRLDAIDSKLCNKMIENGRGGEFAVDWWGKKDPLSVNRREVTERRHGLQIEIELRYGPGAPGRLPRRFKRRK